MARFAIFVALAEEMSYAIDEMKKWGKFTSDPRIDLPRGQTKFNYNLNRFKGSNDRIEVNLIQGMGNIISAAHVGTAFLQGMSLPPELALLVGISGSLNSQNAALGDVIVSNFVKYYSPDKILHIDKAKAILVDSVMRDAHITKGSKGVKPYPEDPDKIGLDDRDLVYGDNAIRFLRDQVFHEDLDNIGSQFVSDANENPKLPFSLRQGALLGSNWVIDSDTYTQYIVQKNDWLDFDFYFLNDPSGFTERCKWNAEEPLAVDMESYGFFKAVAQFSRRSTNVKAYAVRGVSDLCANKGHLDKAEKNVNRKVATENAIFATLLLIQYRLANSVFNHVL